MKSKKKETELFVSVEQMRDIDLSACEKYGIASIILMENAGKSVACEAEKALKRLKNKNIVVVCGSGNNAGDGFVAARYLMNKGFGVKMILAKPRKSFKGDCKINFEILVKLNADICSKERYIDKSGLIIDAILGTGLNGSVTGKTAEIIDRINAAKAYKIAVDIPSGINGDSGEPAGCAVKADKTVTFAFKKNAFKSKTIKKYAGKVTVADIGIPKIAIKDII